MGQCQCVVVRMMCKKVAKTRNFNSAFFKWQSTKRTNIGLYRVWFSSCFVKTWIFYRFSKLYLGTRKVRIADLFCGHFRPRWRKLKYNKKVTVITAFRPGFLNSFIGGLCLSFGEDPVQIGQYWNLLALLKYQRSTHCGPI